MEGILKVTRFSTFSIVWHCEIFRDGQQLFASDPTDIGASQYFHLEVETSNYRNVVLFMEHSTMDKDQNSSNCKWTKPVPEQYINQLPVATYFMEVFKWPCVVAVHFYTSLRYMIQKILASSRFRISTFLWMHPVLSTATLAVIARSSILCPYRTTSLPW